jgi:hypothetical protein
MNEQMKQNLRAKANSYLKRAEEIVDLLKNGSDKKKTAAVDASGRGDSSNKGDDTDSGDIDQKRMMKKFEGRFHDMYLSILNMIVHLPL